MIKKSFRSIFVTAQIFSLVFVFLPKTFAQNSTVKTPKTVYSNTQSITINTASGITAPTAATLYPSSINVSGMTGTITKVAVTLKGVTHAAIQDMDFLLVSPTGAKFVFFSDPQSPISYTVDDRTYTFSDTGASNFLLLSGEYRPYNLEGNTDTFPSPAPSAPYNFPNNSSFAASFNGANPNGTWSLYAVDDALNNAGGVNDGWNLTITTDGSPTTFSNTNYIGFNGMVAPASPYGSPINISGVSGVISTISVTLNGFTHSSPADVDILLVSPNGKSVVVMSDAGGTAAVSNLDLTFNESAASVPPSTLVSGTYKTVNIVNETADTFPAPAPWRPFTSLNGLNDFKGYSPNGEWGLYVVDDFQNLSGSISGGWSLDITTQPATPPTGGICTSPSFTTSNFGAGVNPTNLAVADFNNDGKPDVAVTNQVSNDVSILLGNGNGTFAAQTFVTAGASPYAIVAGKFNSDNNFDLAVANSASNNVSILLGNGDGTFSAAGNFLVGSNPISIAAGDINNNGTEDLIVANFGGFFSGSVSVLLGNGNGGFTAGSSIRTRTQPSYVMIANLNSDNFKDVVVANFGSDSVSTFFGLGNGTFQLNQNIGTVGAGPVALDLFDSNGNGIADLQVANYNSDSVSTCLGNADGTFSSCSTNGIGANPISLASGDFIGSGTKSLAVALSGLNALRILSSNVAVGSFPNAVKTADFNNDGRLDLITANSGSNDVSVLMNNCVAAKGNLFDFDGDRRTDYTIYRPSNENWYIRNQVGGILLQKDFARPTDILVPADYNGDGVTDYGFYRPESGLWFVLDTNSRPIYFYGFGLSTDIPAPADYDGDGKADIAVYRPSNGTWYIRRSSDNSMLFVNFGVNGDQPVALDYDNDGKDDIAVYRPSNGLWAILKSSDSQVILTTFGQSGDRAVPADYDGDGKADIAVYRPAAGSWYILQSSDNGFRSASWGNETDIPVRGDFDGDGKYDVAVYRPSAGIWYILKSSDGGGLFVPWGNATDTPIPSVYVR